MLIPISSPFVFTKAPPLLPGFTAASVWINDSILLLSPPIEIPRPLALTIPAVTVDVRLNGLPTASTHSPTFNFSESPNGIVGRSFASTFINAISVVGSVPISLAENLRLSFNVTSNSSAPSITWLFVIIYPSVEIITPEPDPTRGCGCGR